MNIDAHPHTVRMAAAALSRAALFDDRITEGDSARIAAWAEAMEPHQLQPPDVLAAVTAHYQPAGVDTIRVGDVIQGARAIRRDRAEREKAAEIHEASVITPPNPAIGGLPIPTDGKPVWAAYDVNDAITRTCDRCKAQPNEACWNPVTRQTSKIPCLIRMTGKPYLGKPLDFGETA